MQVPPHIENPFREPERKPDWAQLTRLAGDRVAILFEDLRGRIGNIAGLEEELHYSGSDWGWTPRYRLGDESLFVAHLRPGFLEATIELQRPLREKVLASSRVTTKVKAAIGDAPEKGGSILARFRLSSRADVSSFANLVRLKSKFIERNIPRATTKSP